MGTFAEAVRDTAWTNGRAPRRPTTTPDLHAHPALAALARLGNQGAQRELRTERPRIQAQLVVSAPGDDFEREAERVADVIARDPQAVRHGRDEPNAGQPRVGGATPSSHRLLQRACSCGKPSVGGGECADCRKKREEGLQRSPATAARPSAHTSGRAPAVAPPIVGDVIGGAGQPLDAITRTQMETRFGADFAHVRVHADARAAESARAVDAHAYTVGSHIAFDAGKFAPGTIDGRRLLAHELTHVVQQRGPSRAPVVQRDLAIRPVGSIADARTLSEEDIRTAVRFNRKQFDDPYALAVIRDVIGISRFPAVSDRELAIAVGGWQASHGIAQDGRLEAVTVAYVVEELQAEDQVADAMVLMTAFPKGAFPDVDTSFCGCRRELDLEFLRAARAIHNYTECAVDPAVKVGPDVDECVRNRIRARGREPRILGSTDMSGNITIHASPGPCGPLKDFITLAHERIHSVHTRALRQIHGKGKAFERAAKDPADWARDEIASRDTDIAVAKWAKGILERICP